MTGRAVTRESLHDRVIRLAPCPECDAPIGEGCRGLRERWRSSKRNHSGRVKRAIMAELGMGNVTEHTLTARQIAEVRAELGHGRQNSYTRAIRKDCDAALKGDRACKESVARAWNILRAQGRVG